MKLRLCQNIKNVWLSHFLKKIKLAYNEKKKNRLIFRTYFPLTFHPVIIDLETVYRIITRNVLLIRLCKKINSFTL